MRQLYQILDIDAPTQPRKDACVFVANTKPDVALGDQFPLRVNRTARLRQMQPSPSCFWEILEWKGP